MVLLHKGALKKVSASDGARDTLEELVYNDSTTQNWLRDKIFNRTDKVSRLPKELFNLVFKAMHLSG